MGYSGLIYAAIVAAWAAFLVPRWVRRNEEVERAREADTARGVRVLQRTSTPMHAPHRGVVAEEPPAELAAPAARAGRAPEPAPDVLGEAFADAARRRRRILTVLLFGSVAATGAAYLGRAPGWLPVVAAVLTVFFLFAARRAAVTQAQRRREESRRRRVLADRAAEASGGSLHETGWTLSVDDDTGRRLVLPDETEQAHDPDAWQPVPVPLPTYLTKPMAPRSARTIDLNKPGSWTSGRLDPVGSVELPRRDPDRDERPDSEDPPEHRRAVGD